MKTIIFEYDASLETPDFLNYSPAVWKITVAPENLTYTDDRGVTGFYRYDNTVNYTIKSVVVDGVQYSRATSLADCLVTSESFYYDEATTKLYIQFDDTRPPLNRVIFIGVAQGFILSSGAGNRPYFNDFYYPPLITSIDPIKKAIDPLFFGRLEYPESSVELINASGEFDNWRDLNAFGNRARVLYGDEGDDYDDLMIVYEGNISDDQTNFESFSVDIADQRQELTQPVCQTVLTVTDYPDMSDDYENEVVPVHFGKIFDSSCIPLDENSGGANYTFVFTDTTDNTVTSLDEVRVDGSVVTPSSTNLGAGTFQLASADVSGSFGDVTADFTMSVTNAVKIIYTAMANIDGRTYTASFWDTYETDAAELVARDTSFTADDADTSLAELIEDVALDGALRFFVKDGGLFTIRLFDENREVAHVIDRDEFLDYPEISNTGSEFLSNVTIKYKHRQETDTWSIYRNDAYQSEVFSRYKKLKNKEYETGLYTQSAAEALSEDIMRISRNIKDVIERTVSWNYFDVELCDFVACDPVSRFSQVENKDVYEVIGVKKDVEKQTVQLTLQYVKPYLIDEYEYSVLVDDEGNFICDITGATIEGVEAA